MTKTLLAKDPGLMMLHIESGNELRKFSTGTTHTAQLVKEILSNGGLMPEFMPIYLWGKIFSERFTGKETLIFDGTPRKLMEAQILDSLFPFFGLDKPWIIYLDVDHEESSKRLKLRGRNDDNEDAIKKRLEWYESDVRPSVEYYRTNPNVRFLDIDGERHIETVHADIVKKVGLV